MPDDDDEIRAARSLLEYRLSEVEKQTRRLSEQVAVMDRKLATKDDLAEQVAEMRSTFRQFTDALSGKAEQRRDFWAGIGGSIIVALVSLVGTAVIAFSSARAAAGH